MDASTPRKNPVDARRARKKSLDARRLQISFLDAYQIEYLRKSFPDSKHHYLSATNEHAKAKLFRVAWIGKNGSLGTRALTLLTL